MKNLCSESLTSFKLVNNSNVSDFTCYVVSDVEGLQWT